eukprot:5972906-Pleurochrysis_carterae.AAC.1
MRPAAGVDSQGASTASTETGGGSATAGATTECTEAGDKRADACTTVHEAQPTRPHIHLPTYASLVAAPEAT